MRIQLFLCSLFSVVLSCSAESSRLGNEVSNQVQKVSDAREMLKLETARLVELRDSLQINIRKNQDLGMRSALAKSTETSRLEMQRTVVAAAEKNLKLQEEYLALLKRQIQNTK